MIQLPKKKRDEQFPPGRFNRWQNRRVEFVFLAGNKEENVMIEIEETRGSCSCGVVNVPVQTVGV